MLQKTLSKKFHLKKCQYFFGQLKNQVAVVTGGSQGIGKAIASRFVEEGCKVIISDIDQVQGLKTVKEIRTQLNTKNISFIYTDVSQDQDVENCFKQTFEQHGKINILVNNAALFIFGSVIGGQNIGSKSFTDRLITNDDWKNIFDVNVKGYARCIENAVRFMKLNDLSDVNYKIDQGEGISHIVAGSRGSIINISSVSGFIAQPEFLSYNTVKGAQLQLSKCCALDLAKLNIRVNSILPGSIETPASYAHMRKINLTIQEGTLQTYFIFQSCYLKGRKTFSKDSLFNRQGAPQEIANLALFLASDQASFITGSQIVADGGWTIGRAAEQEPYKKIDEKIEKQQPIEIFDPHFHIWDISDEGLHDKNVLFKPHGQLIYGMKEYENDMKKLVAQDFIHVGGIHVEAMSACYPQKTPQQLQQNCIYEADWVKQNISKNCAKNQYKIVASACLEDPDILKTLHKLSENQLVCGIRQITNFQPDWPRNTSTGNLFRNPQWLKGLSQLKQFNFSFDLQLNPHQFQDAFEILRNLPDLKVIINHLGCPTLEDLQNSQKSQIYWNGIRLLQSLPNTYIKLSMLSYIDTDWDQNPLVIETVQNMIKIWGSQRCLYASNFPSDLQSGWTADTLYSQYKQMSKNLSKIDQINLFGQTAKKVYNI